MPTSAALCAPLLLTALHSLQRGLLHSSSQPTELAASFRRLPIVGIAAALALWRRTAQAEVVITERAREARRGRRDRLPAAIARQALRQALRGPGVCEQRVPPWAAGGLGLAVAPLRHQPLIVLG